MDASPRRSRLRTLPALIIMFTLAACGASDVQLTARAELDLANTQIVSRRSTATVAHARMRTTQDFALTRVAEVEQVGQSLGSTLAALDTGGVLLDIPPIEVTPQPAASITVPPTPAAAAVNQPRLEDIVLSSGKDHRGCATDRNPRFTPGTAEIYVIARAYHIAAGATISSGWRRMGSEVAAISFQAASPLHGDCIWLFIDHSDAALDPGRWSVELRLDGQTMALVPFQIFAN